MNNQDYDKKIEVLNSTLWEHRALRPKIDNWLTNFKTVQEREYALYLLSRLMYFSSSNIRNLLKALYRDLYRYPVIEKSERIIAILLTNASLKVNLKRNYIKLDF